VPGSSITHLIATLASMTKSVIAHRGLPAGDPPPGVSASRGERTQLGREGLKVGIGLAAQSPPDFSLGGAPVPCGAALEPSQEIVFKISYAQTGHRLLPLFEIDAGDDSVGFPRAKMVRKGLLQRACFRRAGRSL
jgi:hypothetical protein